MKFQNRKSSKSKIKGPPLFPWTKKKSSPLCTQSVSSQGRVARAWKKLARKCSRAKAKLKRRLPFRRGKTATPLVSGDGVVAVVRSVGAVSGQSKVRHRSIRRSMQSRFSWILARSHESRSHRSAGCFSASQMVLLMVLLMLEVLVAKRNNSMQILHFAAELQVVWPTTCTAVGMSSMTLPFLKLMRLIVRLKSWVSKRSAAVYPDRVLKEVIHERYYHLLTVQLVTQAFAPSYFNMQYPLILITLPTPIPPVQTLRHVKVCQTMAAALVSQLPSTLATQEEYSLCTPYTIYKSALDVCAGRDVAGANANALVAAITVLQRVDYFVHKVDDDVHKVDDDFHKVDDFFHNVVGNIPSQVWMPINVCTPTCKPWYEYCEDDGYSDDEFTSQVLASMSELCVTNSVELAPVSLAHADVEPSEAVVGGSGSKGYDGHTNWRKKPRRRKRPQRKKSTYLRCTDDKYEEVKVVLKGDVLPKVDEVHKMDKVHMMDEVHNTVVDTRFRNWMPVNVCTPTRKPWYEFCEDVGDSDNDLPF